MVSTTFSKREDLVGKVALVTGSSRGIGRTIALELARRGAKVITNYRGSEKEAHAVVDEIRSLGSKGHAIQADVSNYDDIVRLMESSKTTFGRLDIVMSNSGIEDFTPLLDVTPERFDQVFGVNVRGQFFVAQQAFKHLEDGGSIILTSSIAAATRLPHDHSLYASSNNAIKALARTLSTDIGPDVFGLMRLRREG